MSNDICSNKVKAGIGLSIIMFILVAGGIAWNFPTATNQGYAPEQPIPFSHKIHAGDNKIACLYCHTSPEQSRHSTIPSMNVCMNCHTVVKTESPYVQNIKQNFTENKSIEWVRVHELPDYVYFSHKRHLAKGLACENCHGDVKQMDKMEQFSLLTMGWCMDCHRGKTTPKNVLEQLAKERGGVVGQVAPIDCTTCHH